MYATSSTANNLVAEQSAQTTQVPNTNNKTPTNTTKSLKPLHYINTNTPKHPLPPLDYNSLANDLEKSKITSQRVDDLFSWGAIIVGIFSILVTFIVGIAGIMMPLMARNEVKKATEKAEEAIKLTEEAARKSNTTTEANTKKVEDLLEAQNIKTLDKPIENEEKNISINVTSYVNTETQNNQSNIHESKKDLESIFYAVIDGRQKEQIDFIPKEQIFEAAWYALNIKEYQQSIELYKI